MIDYYSRIPVGGDIITIANLRYITGETITSSDVSTVKYNVYKVNTAGNKTAIQSNCSVNANEVMYANEQTAYNGFKYTFMHILSGVATESFTTYIVEYVFTDDNNHNFKITVSAETGA